MKKTVIINRAISSSGKSSISDAICKVVKNYDLTISVHSTDNYFIVNGEYIFNFDKLKSYHEKNLEAFENSINNGTDIVICDNTNIAPWETESYTNIAREYNYQIVIISLDPREIKEHLLSQQVSDENPFAHGIEEDTLRRMVERYYIFDDLLNPNIVINSNKHINYIWDEEKQEKVDVKVAKHFNSDFVIRIMPDKFIESKLVIGKKILDLLYEGEDNG